MKIFLTGGRGFFGTAIINEFLKHDAHLTLLTRKIPQLSPSHNIHFALGDISNKHSIRNIKGKFDVLIHAAAHMPQNAQDDDPYKAITTNVLGTLNLLETVGKNCKKIVYVSSIDVYGGSSDKKVALNENSPFSPRTYYGATKLSGEQITQIFCQTHGLPLTILRFTVLYGPGDTINRAIPNFIQSALSKQALQVNAPHLLRDYLSTSEAARALYLASITSKTGTYVIGSGKSLTIEKTANTIIKTVNPLLKIKSSPVSKAGFHVRLNCREAKKAFGFIAKPFPYDLQQTILWQKHHLHK